MSQSSVHDRLTWTIARYGELGAADRAAIDALPLQVRGFPATSYFIREGQHPKRCALLLEGFTYRQKLTVEGHRALLSLQVPGDFIDLQNLMTCRPSLTSPPPTSPSPTSRS